MHWSDEGYLLSKNNFDENSIIIEAFTLKHGKYSGVVYGGASKKQKKNFQIGNKILLNWRSKNENKFGYFNVELIKPIGPLYFEDKKKIACILSATSILKILLPERQINENIYESFEKMINALEEVNWIYMYLNWELNLIKELGYELSFLYNDKEKKIYSDQIIVNKNKFKIPQIYMDKDQNLKDTNLIKEALVFNKNLLIENFISPNNLKFPLFRNLLENYY